ncbi:MAG: glycosyltransferase [Chlorobiaceae bacterium]|nr:glycosyltransferase [Chlorobiaceae bacterium]
MLDFSELSHCPQPLKLEQPWSWAGHIPFAMWLTKLCRPERLVELGTHFGHSYFSFCQSALHYNTGTKCFAVDTWQGDHHAGYYGESIFNDVSRHNKAHYREFSTLLRETFDEALCRFNDGSIDLLHIDGLHTYDAVKHDFTSWLPKMSVRGIVLFHDTAVKKDDFGVWQFWEELSAIYPAIAFDHSYGLGMVVVGESPDAPVKELLEAWKNPMQRSLIKTLFSEAGRRTELQTENLGKDQYIVSLHNIVIERDASIIERDSMIIERDALIVERNNMITERDASIIERDNMIIERDASIVERDNMIIERDTQLRKITGSSSWRMTKPIRKISNSVRKRGRKLRKLLFKQQDTIPAATTAITPNESDYQQWIERFESLNEEQLRLIDLEIRQMEHPPLISIIMPVYNPTLPFLDEAIMSVRNQSYPRWELCIADDCSPDPEVRTLIERHMHEDERIKTVFRKVNGHISEASNSALEIAVGEYIALLDHDDILHPQALYWNAKEIIEHPDAALIYSDEDKIDESGRRSGPYFKSDYNYDLFLCQNMISHFGIYHTPLIKTIGGFRKGLEGSQDYDLALRAVERLKPDQIRHIPRVLYHWRIHEQSTASGIKAKPYARTAAFTAVEQHLERCAINATIEDAPEALIFNRVRYAVPSPQPLVEIIISLHSGENRLNRCIHSIITKTLYTNYRVTILETGQNEQQTIKLSREARSSGRIKIVRDDKRPFNYSDICNRAVKASAADIICLMSSEIEVISPEWLDEMVGHAVQPGVGAVGARLWFPDNKLQHGGIVLGSTNVATHVHQHLPKGYTGYFARACLQQTFSAVSGACMLLGRKVYDEVGGFNEDELSAAYQDIDLCLKLREKGLRTVWTPYAEMIYHEPVSQRDNNAHPLSTERAYMQKRWAAIIGDDPAYSRNLSLTSQDCSYAWPPRVNG